MLKQRNEQIQLIIRTSDAIICVVAFFAAVELRFSGFLFHGADKYQSLESASWILAASLTLHLILYPLLGFYASLRMRPVIQIISMIFKAFLIEIFVLGSLVFFFQAKDTSRWFFGFFLSLNYGFILIERVVARVGLATLRRRGYNYRQVLVVGSGDNAKRVVEILEKNKHWGYIPFGYLGETGMDSNDGASRIPQLGTLSDLEAIIRRQTVDEVFFALDEITGKNLTDSVSLCETLGIPARFSLGLFDLPHSRVIFNDFGSLPVVTFYRNFMTPIEAWLKRAMDIVVALLGLLITGILYPWISWKIKKDSPGPIIFKQVRIGENGRRFKCYKFRTMYSDAEIRKQELAAANKMEGPVFKIENDPRITPFGHFLRKTSLDELPQFFNILRGDMSVVGTRPPTPDEVIQYTTHFRRRLSIRPGLTGLWQVSGRNNIRKFEEILALDLQYIDRWSLWLDIRIIFRTIWVALFRQGAL